jgi:hypothetical protein
MLPTAMAVRAAIPRLFSVFEIVAMAIYGEFENDCLGSTKHFARYRSLSTCGAISMR